VYRCAVVKRVIAWQMRQELKAQNLNKTTMAKKMHISRTALTRRIRERTSGRRGCRDILVCEESRISLRFIRATLATLPNFSELGWINPNQCAYKTWTSAADKALLNIFNSSNVPFNGYQVSENLPIYISWVLVEVKSTEPDQLSASCPS